MSRDYKVGYGRPPEDTKWKKGECPNPNGRPRKAKKPKSSGAEDLKLTAPQFNRAILSGAERDATVNGKTMSMRDAIFQSLTAQAARGGILAIRTWLNVTEREEAKLREVLLPIFISWAAFKFEGQEVIRKAIANGEAEPLILPHPDDILLDRDNLRVKLVGPATEEELGFYEGLRDTRDLFYELMMFTETALVTYGDPANHCIGLLGLEWADYHLRLPNRLRGMEKCLDRMTHSRWRGDHYWEQDLRRRCEERSLDFGVLSNPRLMATVPIKKLGMKFERGLPVPATAKARRELRNLAKANEEGGSNWMFEMLMARGRSSA